MIADSQLQRPQETSSTELLEIAVAAAEHGDIASFLEAIHQSRLPAGLVQRIQSRWPRLHDEAEDIVGEAFDAAYDSMRSGTRVRSLGAYVFKAADHIAHDRWEQSRISEPLSEELGGEGRGASLMPGPDREEMLASAITTARRLLPLLGQQSIQVVMGYLLDAIEAGRHDVPNEELVEVLGLSSETVRQSKSRAWVRLARVAQQQGIPVTEFREEYLSDGEDDE
jgi:DNA-directed RNA polymerase specialized sigma24 family protein